MEFLTPQEKTKLQQILINHSLLRAADADFRSALLINCGLGTYCSLLPLNANNLQFVITLCSKFSEVYITVDNSEKIALVVFLEYISESDPNLSTEEQEFIKNVITKLEQGQKHNTSRQQAEQLSSLPDLFLAPSKPTYELVGRSDLLKDLKQRLLAGNNLALSALNGLPGVGKTALAIELANDREVQEHFQDGVLWVGLGREPDVLAQLSLWGKAVGISQIEMAKLTGLQDREKAIEAVTKTIQAAIGERRMLLVVDDAWDSETALVFRLGGYNCAHLVTTRLNTVALDFAEDGAKAIPELNEVDGLKLLARFASKAVQAEENEAKALVKAVGGLPLALTLMGKYLQKEACSGQARRIRTALNKLKLFKERLCLAQPQAPVERHTSLPSGTPLSLQAVIGISDEALDEASKSTMYTLSVFPPKPNTFSEEAALAVSSSPVETLDTLYDFGLLESSGEGRYTLHQTIADYARLKLTDTTAGERMAEFFVGYVETHEADYSLLDIENNNVLTALQAAFEQEILSALVRGANGLYRFWDVRGFYTVAEIHLNRAKQSALYLGQEAQLATTLLNIGRIIEKRGDYEQAKKYYHEGLVLSRRIQSREQITGFLVGLGVVAIFKGDYSQAEEYLHEGLALAREIKQDERTIILLKNLGALAGNRGDYLQAEAYYQEGLTIARKNGLCEGISGILQGLGWIEHNRGNYLPAEAYYQEGLALAYEIGHRERIGVLLMNIGCVAHELENYEKAETYYQEALDMSRKIGRRETISNCLDNLGSLKIKCGDYKQAADCLEEGLALARDIEHSWLISSILNKWGELYVREKKIQLALEAFSESLSIAKNVGIQDFIGDALYGLAQVAFAQGKLVKAHRQGQESLAIFQAICEHKAAEVKQWLAELPPVKQGI